MQSLTTQADIIAAAIAASAAVDTDTITIDPDKLLQLRPGRERGAVAKRRGRHAILDQPGAGRAGAASAGDADPHARAHLRQRRPASARFALAFRPRRGGALGSARWRSAAALPIGSSPSCAGSFHPAHAPRTTIRGRPMARPCRKWPGRSRAKRNPWCASTHEGETIVSVAVPIQHMMATARRAPALDPGRRHRPRDRVRALAPAALLSGARGGDAGAVAFARQHDRRAGAAARRRRRAGAARHPVAPADSRFHRALGRDRPSVARAARHDAGALQPHRRDREFRRRRRA